MLVYGLTSVGATVHLHYCMNEYVSWDLAHSKEDNKCGKCGMTDKKSGCCKDEYKQVKLSVDQQDTLQKDFTAPFNFDFNYPLASEYSLPLNYGVVLTQPIEKFSSPLRRTIPLFITYCSFLI